MKRFVRMRGQGFLTGSSEKGEDQQNLLKRGYNRG